MQLKTIILHLTESPSSALLAGPRVKALLLRVNKAQLHYAAFDSMRAYAAASHSGAAGGWGTKAGPPFPRHLVVMPSSVGSGSSLTKRRSSNHRHAITLRPLLSTPTPRFICVAPAGLTAEQFLGGAAVKYISLIKDIW